MLLEPKIGDGGVRGEPYLTQIESDPWGNPYMYVTEGDGFGLWSMGSDGLNGSDDDIGPDICEI